ncbi:unnamed protein product [Adineta steineri]|uniref:Uncharacterized protein n=2 Tax=Adineta steineri TaxID=433720 RepID=A0A819GQX9_9BILA|nr:unnamed protein product [Adineta steineri]CAF3885556.1 unnamed protein product [Adineta steineri]CAF4008481.1 unnamed protein product [Adineta steineri]
MLLSNSKIDYSTVRRMPPIKISGQTQGTPMNPMSISTSLQDINALKQNFTWNANDKDEPLLTAAGRQLSSSISDERVFEHPEVTIKPSSLDDELQRRSLTMKISNTSENLVEREGGTSAPNILEHPDMRSPVVLQTQQSSSPSFSSIIQTNSNQVTRTQSVDLKKATNRTPSPSNRVNFYITDDHENSKRSGSFSGGNLESPGEEKNEDLSSLTHTENFPREYSDSCSKSNIHPIKAKKNDSW